MLAKQRMAMSPLGPESQRALDSLRQAVAEALEHKRRLGQYAVIWQDGRPVQVVPDKAEPAQALSQSEPSA
jgi:hypothetical protein